jgi:hypothetical protein
MNFSGGELPTNRGFAAANGFCFEMRQLQRVDDLARVYQRLAFESNGRAAAQPIGRRTFRLSEAFDIIESTLSVRLR